MHGDTIGHRTRAGVQLSYMHTGVIDACMPNAKGAYRAQRTVPASSRRNTGGRCDP
jgi:hypothetical protein